MTFRPSFLLLLSAYVAARQAPRGWNSWDNFVGDAPETALLEAAAYMSDNLLPYGWSIVTCDEGWYQGNRSAFDNVVDAYGRPTPDLAQFPSARDGMGFKSISDKVHAMGLLLGVWTLRGIPKIAVAQNLPVFGTNFTLTQAASDRSPCVWQPQTMGCALDENDATQCNAAAKAYYLSVANWYAEQGIDLVKIDCMGGIGDTNVSGLSNPDLFAFTAAMRGAGLTVSLSSGNGVTPANGTLYAAEGIATQYRTTPDFWDTWLDPYGPEQFPSGLRSKLDTALAYQQLWEPNNSEAAFAFDYPWTGGVWPDLDMLQLGDICHFKKGAGVGCGPADPSPTQFTRDEQTLLMSLWTATGAPLVFGGRLPIRSDDTWTLSLLTNTEILALHGNTTARAPINPVGGQGYPYYAWTGVPTTVMPPAAYATLLNGDNSSANITVKLSDLRLVSGPKYCARDLWAQAPYPGGQGLPESGMLTVEVAAHGAAVMLLQSC